MSIGQRIALKRKELGLSQEALGDQMGVSRQAIYKWESDLALPEIDKLVSLSKLFSVSVGWLLGVEEGEDTAKEESRGMSQEQLDLVEEIVGRYIASQPKPKPQRRWPWVLAACVLVFVIVQLFGRIDQLNSQYSNLQSSVSNISHSVNSQVNGLAGRVEQILMAQNHLTAEWSAEIVHTDYQKGNVTLSMKAVPKTYIQGMGAVFLVDCGNGPQEFQSILVDSHTFTCQATVALTDKITASVVFVTADGTRQTQVLDTYSWLLSDSYTQVHMDDHELMWKEITDGKLRISNMYITLWNHGPGKGGAEIAQLRLGIFRGQTLLAWAEPCDRPAGYIGDYTNAQFFRLAQLTVDGLETGDTIAVAALVTDSFGRQYMICDVPYEVAVDSQSGSLQLTWASEVRYDRDPSKWIFD